MLNLSTSISKVMRGDKVGLEHLRPRNISPWRTATLQYHIEDIEKPISIIGIIVIAR